MRHTLSQLYLFRVLTLVTARRVFRRKVFWALLVLGLLPCLVSCYWIAAQFWDALRATMKPYSLFLTIESSFFLGFYMPLTAVFLGLGAVSEEITTKNITFTLVRPINRVTLVLGRLCGHFVAGFVLISVTLTANYFANMLFQVEDFFANMPFLANGVFVLSFGLVAYLAGVAAMGTWWRKMAIMGAVVWLIADQLFGRVNLDVLQSMSVSYRMLVSFWELPPQQGITLATIEQGSAFLNALVVFVFAAAAAAVAAARLVMFEIVLSDNSK